MFLNGISFENRLLYLDTVHRSECNATQIEIESKESEKKKKNQQMKAMT